MLTPDVMVFRGMGPVSFSMMSSFPTVPVITPWTVSMLATEDMDGSRPHTGALRILSTGLPSMPVLRM